MIVVDTSVLVDYFRQRDTSATRLLASLDEGSAPFAIPAACCQELLQGAKNEKEWELLADYLGTQRVLLSENPWLTHLGAARIYFDLRRQGITVRSTVDCWIAQLVLEADATLLHDDGDFDEIARVRELSATRGDADPS